MYLHRMQVSVTTKVIALALQCSLWIPLCHALPDAAAPARHRSAGAAPHALDHGHVRALAPMCAIVEVALQRELYAREGQLGPRHFRLLVERRRQALVADAEAALHQARAIEHVDLARVRHADDAEQAANLD